MPITLERPEITSSIDALWTNSAQAREEFASLSLETNRIPDPYRFSITANGELFSPSALCLVKDKVEDKTGPLGSLEYRAVRSIEQWAAKTQEGAIVWVSPPHSGVYPSSKIIVSEIEYADGNKKLFNRAIVLAFDGKKCLELAQDLAQLSQNRPLLSHLDEVRATPLILDTRNKPWINILEQLIDDPALWESIRNGDDQRAKKEALRQAAIVQKALFTAATYKEIDDARKAAAEMMGSKSGSCPVRFTRRSKTGLQVFSESSQTFRSNGISKDPDHCEFCPVCEEKIDCIVRAGGSCPKCRAVKRCG